MMLPSPIIDYIPKIYAEAKEDRMYAFTDMVDSVISNILSDLILLGYMYDPARCPAEGLNALGEMLSAGILSADSETTKRKKISSAQFTWGISGLWANIKGSIDAITGYSCEIFTNHNRLVDSNGNYLVDSKGDFLSGISGITGNFWIDLGDGGTLSSTIIANVVQYFTSTQRFAYFAVTIGWASGNNFTIYEVIE